MTGTGIGAVNDVELNTITGVADRHGTCSPEYIKKKPTES